MQLFKRSVSARGLTAFGFEILLVAGSLLVATLLYGPANDPGVHLADRASNRARPRVSLFQRLLRPDDCPVRARSRHSPLPGRRRRLDPARIDLLGAAGRRRPLPRVLSLAVSVAGNHPRLAVRVQPADPHAPAGRERPHRRNRPGRARARAADRRAGRLCVSHRRLCRRPVGNIDHAARLPAGASARRARSARS